MENKDIESEKKLIVALGKCPKRVVYLNFLMKIGSIGTSMLLFSPLLR